MDARLRILRRKQLLEVSWDEVGAGLGPGFSRARLSAWGRGTVGLGDWEVQMVEAAIERIGEVRSKVREVLDISSQIDLAKLCSDIREGRSIG